MPRPSAKLRIEAAALSLFAQKGVAGTSIRDIAGAAGVSEGALYRHFTGKDEMVAALFAEGYGALARSLAALAVGRGFPERLRAMIEGLCALHDREPDLFNFMLVVQHEQLPRYDGAGGSPVDVLRGLIEAGIATGEVEVRDPELATALVLGQVVQTATFKLYGRITRPMSALASSLADAALRALGSPASGGES